MCDSIYTEFLNKQNYLMMKKLRKQDRCQLRRIMREFSQVMVNILYLDISLGYRCMFCQNSVNCAQNLCISLYVTFEIKRCSLLGRKANQPRQHIKKQRHYFANKGSSSQGYGFSSGHVRVVV